jgi:hypothetical protein
VSTEAAQPEFVQGVNQTPNCSTNTTTSARQNQVHACVNHVAMEDAQAVSHPGFEKRNRSIRTCAQHVQLTRTADNMINRRNISIKQSNISYIMTRGSEKDYIKVAAILSVV